MKKRKNRMVENDIIAAVADSSILSSEKYYYQSDKMTEKFINENKRK